jgi:hypothetical protein
MSMEIAKAKTIVSVGLLLVFGGCGSSGETADGGSGGKGGGASSGAAGHGGRSGKTDAGVSTCPALIAITGFSVGTISWLDNGTLECGALVLAQRNPATLADTIEIDAPSTTDRGVDIVLSSYNGPLGGTYSCQTGNGLTAPNVMFEVTGLETGGFAAMSACTITIAFTTDSAGTEHAHGTFSGTVTGDGGTDVITDGTFDITVTLQGG